MTNNENENEYEELIRIIPISGAYFVLCSVEGGAAMQRIFEILEDAEAYKKELILRKKDADGEK